MFATTRCRAGGCDRPTPLGRPQCSIHDPDPSAAAAVRDTLAAGKSHRDLSAPGVPVGPLDLGGCLLEGCDFSRGVLEDVDFRGCNLRLVYFDFATLTRCRFEKADLSLCVFAGATLRDCSFEGSEVVQSSFVGATLTDTRFDGSDLYASRFVAATLTRVTMRDCNLKEVHFDHPASVGNRGDELLALLGVDGTASNTEEAVFGGER